MSEVSATSYAVWCGVGVLAFGLANIIRAIYSTRGEAVPGGTELFGLFGLILAAAALFGGLVAHSIEFFEGLRG